MRSILTIAFKDLILMRRDWLGMFFIIGFPILMGVLFGMIAGAFSGGEGASLEIAIVDKDNSEMSKKFVESLKGNDNVQVRSLNEEEALDQVRRGNLTGVIIIPEQFGETAGIFWAPDRPAVQIGVDPSRHAEAGMLQGLVMQSTGDLMAARLQDPGSMKSFIQQASNQIARDENMPPALRPLLSQMMSSLAIFMDSLDKVQQEADEDSGSTGMPELQFANVETIDVTRKPAEGSTEALVQKLRSKWDISFPQAMMWGVLASTAAFAITMVRERTQGTFLRLQVAPVSRGQVFIGKATACAMTVLGVIVGMVVLGMLLGMRPRSPMLLVLATVCVAYCFVGVMMLMSVIGKSEEAVSGAAWGSNVVMAMFGGGMIPLAFMPPFMKTVSHLSPVKWGILSLEGAIWRDFTLAEMFLPCAVLAIIGSISLTIGAVVLSRNSG